MNYMTIGNVIKLQIPPRSGYDDEVTDEAIRNRYHIKQKIKKDEGLVVLEGPILENLFMYAKDRLQATKATCSTKTKTVSFLKLPIEHTKFKNCIHTTVY